MPSITLDLDRALARITAARAALPAGRRLMIGLAGAPGSGKSTTARELAAALGGCAVVVPMDGFHLSNAELDRRGLRERKGAPETFDVPGFIELLAGIRSGHDVAAPAFDRTIDASIRGAIPVDGRATVVIVEGNYLLFDGAWAPVRAQLDEVWFLDLDPAVRRERLVRRHMEFGRTRAEAIAWASDVDEANAIAITDTRARATAVLDPTASALPRSPRPATPAEKSSA